MSLARAAFATVLAAACLTAAAVPARADVLEIDETGEVVLLTRTPAKPVAVTRDAQGSTALAPLFARAEQRTDVSASLIEAVAWTESRFQTRAVSPKGAQGVMQLMPGTARMLGVSDATNPAQNIQGGATYLRSLLQEFGGDTVLALAAYNAGPGAVRRYGGVPPYPETRAYVDRVLARLAALSDAER
ncbi:lytic transglycosylase domain-containing protein [Caulobacter sp. NIBR2454]|uniref:lytic transglycosylase domain-containing protein n=1 Tax=Caulobacter sp. NIBR2454 TaxID=3015996 RepID=UPI0022B639FB|nr:lytic transglycosylase domain-containing protein [Caulobacter sp. NIBR2454]